MNFQYYRSYVSFYRFIVNDETINETNDLFVYIKVHIKEIQLKCKKLSNIKSTTILNDRTIEEKCIAM